MCVRVSGRCVCVCVWRASGVCVRARVCVRVSECVRVESVCV